MMEGWWCKGREKERREEMRSDNDVVVKEGKGVKRGTDGCEGRMR